MLLGCGCFLQTLFSADALPTCLPPEAPGKGSSIRKGAWAGWRTGGPLSRERLRGGGETAPLAPVGLLPPQPSCGEPLARRPAPAPTVGPPQPFERRLGASVLPFRTSATRFPGPEVEMTTPEGACATASKRPML